MNRPSPSFSVFRLALVGAFLLIFALFNPQANGWPIRGMAYFLAFRPYRPERVAEDLRRIRELGFNWVSLDVALTQETATSSEVYLPYGDGSYVHPALPYRYEPEAWFHFPPEWAVGHFVTTAHRLGLRVLFKPHVHPKDSGMRVLLSDGSGRDPMLGCSDPRRRSRALVSFLRGGSSLLRRYLPLRRDLCRRGAQRNVPLRG
ncbi:MAG: hypothetical protein KatS3mg115_2267 [Candidatus Poribacteria bacterium]|nr:MAG: hypothetical protein KatS3mg115_2267 [Candidatus Poribacteria bacterium]